MKEMKIKINKNKDSNTNHKSNNSKKKIKPIFYKQTNFALFNFVTLSQHIQTPVTLVSHSHDISQLVLLDHCNQYQQPTDDDPYYI